MRALLSEIEDEDHVLSFVLVECDALAGSVLYVERRGGVGLPSRRTEPIERGRGVLPLGSGRGIPCGRNDSGGGRTADNGEIFVSARRDEQQSTHRAGGLLLLSRSGISPHEAGEREQVVAREGQGLLERLRGKSGTPGLKIG